MEYIQLELPDEPIYDTNFETKLRDYKLISNDSKQISYIINNFDGPYEHHSIADNGIHGIIM